MNKLTEKMYETARYGYCTTQGVATLFPQSEDGRYGLVKRAMCGDLCERQNSHPCSGGTGIYI